MSNPLEVFDTLLSMKYTNPLTLLLTIEALLMMILMRKKLEKIPLIGVVVIIGLLLNLNHLFMSFSDVCNLKTETEQTVFNCEFAILDQSAVVIPKTITPILNAIPHAFILTLTIIFEQFLFIEEF